MESPSAVFLDHILLGLSAIWCSLQREREREREREGEMQKFEADRKA